MRAVISTGLKNKTATTFGTGKNGAQYKFDSEVLRLTDPFTPKDTGTLIASAKLYSKLGQGKLVWQTPYARAQYYVPRSVGTQTGYLRGYRWGERAKTANLKHLQEFAANAVKGGME